MNLNNFHLRDNPMKRSFLAECPQNQPQHPRNSLMKRSSFTGTPLAMGQYQQTFQFPKTPKPVQSANNSNSNSQLLLNPRQEVGQPHYHHSSNYSSVGGNISNGYTYHLSQALSNTPNTNVRNYATNPQGFGHSNQGANKIQAFSLEEKKNYEEPKSVFEQKKLGQQDKKSPIADLLREINIKLEKTISQVNKHEKILSSEQIHNKEKISRLITSLVDQHTRSKQTQTRDQINIIKDEIAGVKNQILNSGYVGISEMEEKLRQMKTYIHSYVQGANKEIMGNFSYISEFQNEARRKDIQLMRSYIQEKVEQLDRTIEQKYKKQKQQPDCLTQSSSTSTIPPGKYFIGDPLLLKFLTKVSITVKCEESQIQQSEIVYKIDDKGYLLDGQGHYIINSKYEQVKLGQQQIELLKANGFVL